MLTVACVYTGARYSEDWVHKLRRGVERNLQEPHRFVCLGLDEPLKHDWPGWWSKIELFRAFTERTLYLDLDVLVMRDLAPIVDQKTTRLTMMRERGRDIANSSVMFWSRPHTEIYDRFRADPDRWMAEYGGDQWPAFAKFGDQAFIADNAKTWFWPPEWIHIFSLDGSPTFDEAGAEIVSVCCGEPKFDRYPDAEIVKRHWI